MLYRCCAVKEKETRAQHIDIRIRFYLQTSCTDTDRTHPARGSNRRTGAVSWQSYTRASRPHHSHPNNSRIQGVSVGRSRAAYKAHIQHQAPTSPTYQSIKLRTMPDVSRNWVEQPPDGTNEKYQGSLCDRRKLRDRAPHTTRSRGLDDGHLPRASAWRAGQAHRPRPSKLFRWLVCSRNSWLSPDAWGDGGASPDTTADKLPGRAPLDGTVP